MGQRSSPLRLPVLAVCLVALGIALGFALYTDHVWEDFYITYKSSRNLATGHGLVYHPGERLHTFTSPLGVLLPAMASLLTGNGSDVAALWIFRLWSAAALAGAAALLLSVVRTIAAAGGGEHSKPQPLLPATFAASWLILDPKSVDFTINGMETGFLLLFAALAFWATFAPVNRRWRWLGCAWAGLMWTRPDGFIYVLAVALGGLLFGSGRDGRGPRREWVRDCSRAALLCTALYLPWFAGAWIYYGSPVPFTIVAKSAAAEGTKTLSGLAAEAWRMFAHAGGTSAVCFLPPYSEFGGWPAWLRPAAAAVGWTVAFGWILPFLAGPVRLASFAFFVVNLYLSYFPNYPYPWYLPGAFLFAVLCLAGAGGQLWRVSGPWGPGTRRFVRALCGLAAVVVLVTSAWLLVASARQMRAQQQYVETGTRRAIGEWLRTAASPGDTVFLEPLGYVGFFSGLKTFDYPGLSSREMVAARQRVGNDWAALIRELRPTWLVLRPKEIERIRRSSSGLLAQDYAEGRVFSTLEQVRRLELPGRAYLEHDAEFTVFRRK